MIWLGEGFCFSVGSGLQVRWVGSGANRHDWRDLGSAFVKSFINEYSPCDIVIPNSWVAFDGARFTCFANFVAKCVQTLSFRGLVASRKV